MRPGLLRYRIGSFASHVVTPREPAQRERLDAPLAPRARGVLVEHEAATEARVDVASSTCPLGGGR